MVCTIDFMGKIVTMSDSEEQTMLQNAKKAGITDIGDYCKYAMLLNIAKSLMSESIEPMKEQLSEANGLFPQLERKIIRKRLNKKISEYNSVVNMINEIKVKHGVDNTC